MTNFQDKPCIAHTFLHLGVRCIFSYLELLPMISDMVYREIGDQRNVYVFKDCSAIKLSRIVETDFKHWYRIAPNEEWIEHEVYTHD